MATDKKTSILIPRQLPQYIRRDHPGFIEFLEAYYEWMELNGNAQDLSKNLLSYQDIDTTLDDFIKYFKAEFLSRLPETLFVDPLDSSRTVDKRKLIKNIKQFYRAKGTEKSYRFLFRILFDTEIDFYYPRVDMLKPSDGKWFQDISIRVRQLTGNPFSWAGQKIRGEDSNTTAFVEHVQKISVGPLEVYEIFLNRSSIIGQFLPDENITSETVPGVSGKTYHLLVGINLIAPGLGYSIGDEIAITQSGPGFGAAARVENVDEFGRILKIKIIDYGAGYSSGILSSEIVFPVQPEMAVGTAIIGGQTLYPGYFLNDDGKISDAKFIQDSHFYQQFSYVIKVGQSIETYRNIVKELIHPAGLLMFGEFFTQNLMDARLSLPTRQSVFVKIQRHVGFQPYGLYEEPPVIPPDYIVQNYVINCKASIAQNLITLRPVVDQRTRGSISSFKLGPSLRSIERGKFTYLPTFGSTDATSFVAPNIGYFDLYANYQLEQFETLKIYQFEGPFQFLTLVLGSGSGTFIEDELVFQGLDINNNTFKGQVMGYNDDGTLVIKVLSGTLRKSISGSPKLRGNTSSSLYDVDNITNIENGVADKINIMPEPVLRTSN